MSITVLGVKDLKKASEVLREEGYVPLGEAMPAPAIEGRLVAFYLHKQLGMIEIVECG